MDVKLSIHTNQFVPEIYAKFIVAAFINQFYIAEEAIL